jgi:hypothetical protein
LVSRGTPDVKPTEIQWAQLAAYIDGEGCISILYRPTKSVWTSVLLYNTDPRLCLWAQRTFGCGTIHAATHGRKNERPSYRWQIYSRQAFWVLENCLPYFVIKREQAEVCLALRETRYAKGRSHRLPQHVEVRRAQLKSHLQELKERIIPFEKTASGEALYGGEK